MEPESASPDAPATEAAAARWWVTALFVVAFPVVAAVAINVAGAAGYRFGWFWTGLVVAVAPAVLAWRRMEPLGTGRVLWVIALVVAGLTATAWLVDNAPLSKAQLGSRLDPITPPFTTTLSEKSSGHSWCRPTCPRVTRVLRAPNTAPFAALFQAAAIMRVEGLLPTVELIGQRHPVEFIRVFTDRMVVEVRVAKRSDHLRMTITLTATKGRVRRPLPVQSDRTINLSTQ